MHELTGPDPGQLTSRDYALEALTLDVAVYPAKEDGTKMPISEPVFDENGKPVLDEKGAQRHGWIHRQAIRATPGG